LLPQYVREVFGVHFRMVRAVGGGWLSRLTGQWWASPYSVHLPGGGTLWVTQSAPFPAP
jgi:hypothetical protein